MTREDVIKGLECCLEDEARDLKCWENGDYPDCPYNDHVDGCMGRLNRDALALLKAQPVIHCKDCTHCYSLAEEDPRLSYDGSGSFYCAAFDMDFYAPRYNAETYFCADGERKDASEVPALSV